MNKETLLLNGYKRNTNFSSDNFIYHSFAPTAWYENYDYIIFIFFVYNFTNFFFTKIPFACLDLFGISKTRYGH